MLYLKCECDREKNIHEKLNTMFSYPSTEEYTNVFAIDNSKGEIYGYIHRRIKR